MTAARFTPGMRPIKVYEDGRITYRGKEGSIIGATARIDASGSKRIFRDTREVFLLIEGPDVGLSIPLVNKNHSVRARAQRFAARVNQLSMRLAP